ADRMGGAGDRAGLGRRVRGAAAARLQLLPLPGRRRSRGRGSDVADLREGVARPAPLPPRPGELQHLAHDDRAPGRDRSRAKAQAPRAARRGDGCAGGSDPRRGGRGPLERGAARAAPGGAARSRARAGGAQIRSRMDAPRDRAADGTHRDQRRHHPAPHGAGAAGRLGERRRTMMDDRFMHELEREPRPGFARALRERLRAVEGNEAAPGRGLARLAAILAPGLGVAAVASLFLFPSVRASAQAFLDLFRIRTFTAVTVDAARMRQLESGNLDLKSLIGEKVQTVKDPGPPRVVASAQLAGASAGYLVKVPTTLPAGL